MSVDNRRGYAEMMNLNPNNTEDFEIIKNEYRAVDIDKVTIDGNTYTNYGNYQFILEKTYAIAPERSAGGVIDNLNGISTFLTPRLIMDFKYMPIDDYRSIMQQHYEKNEHTVSCYDPIYNVKRTYKMYFATEEMAKLHIINRKFFNRDNGEWEDWLLLAGVTEYQVELIGTNAPLDKLSVIYHLNPPSDTGFSDMTEGEPDVYYGEEFVMGANSTFPQETFNGKYFFDGWNIRQTAPDEEAQQGNFINGNVYTLTSNLTLYAKWKSYGVYTLSYNYGVAQEYVQGKPSKIYPITKEVEYNIYIGALPVIDGSNIPVTYKGRKFYPYTNGAWYKTPIKYENSNPITQSTLYWAKADQTIYYLYDVNKYTLSLVFTDNSDQTSTYRYKYGDTISFPTYVFYELNKTFDGWYINNTFTTKFTETTMPPLDLTLYARWVEK